VEARMTCGKCDSVTCALLSAGGCTFFCCAVLVPWNAAITSACDCYCGGSGDEAEVWEEAWRRG